MPRSRTSLSAATPQRRRRWQDELAELGGDGVELAIFLDDQCTVYSNQKSFADIPSYYAWQIKPTQVRMSDLQQWVDPFMPLYNGLALILRLLRESGNPVELEAPQGAYQEMLTGKTFQLLRVWVDPALGVFPEMSANKYVIWVRFSMQDNELKPISVTQRIPFRLSRCNF